MSDEATKQLAEGAGARFTAAIGRSGLKECGGAVHEEFDADLRGLNGIKIFEEMRRNDPTIAVGLRAINWLIGQVNWTVEPGGETAEDRAAAEFLESCLDDMSHTWSKVVRDALTCLPFGWSWLEMTMKVRNGSEGKPPSRYDDGRIGWRKMTLIGQDSWSRWEFDGEGGVAGLWQQGDLIGGRFQAETLIPIEKSVLFRLEDEKNNPNGVSLLRPVFNAWYNKKQIQEVEAIGIERDLTGTLIVNMPVGATSTDYNKALDLVEQFKSDDMSGFVAPRYGPGDHERWLFEVIGSPGSKAIDTDKVIQRYQLEIARSFLAQFLLLGQGSTGSWALARDQRGIFEVALGAILMNLDETINRFMVPPLFRLNDFGKLAALPQLKPGRISKADMDKFSKGLAALATAGLLTPDTDLERYIREEMDLPELSEVETEEAPAEETGQDEDKAKQQKELAEPDEDEDFELPDPDDDEAWAEWDKESVKRIERSGRRKASELLQFARRYNYARKLEQHQMEYRERMRGLAQQLREGSMSHGQWKYRSQVEIARYTSDGYRLGKAQAQGLSPSKVKITAQDRKAIAKSVQSQYEYFAEFSKQTRAKLAAGEELTTYVDARAAKYGGSARSAMNEAYVAGQGETRLRWVRHKDDSCPTCLEQAGKVKTGREWAEGGILPSQNVQCDGMCGCELHVVKE